VKISELTLAVCKNLLDFMKNLPTMDWFLISAQARDFSFVKLISRFQVWFQWFWPGCTRFHWVSDPLRIIVRSCWDFRNKIVITFVMNAAEENFYIAVKPLKCCTQWTKKCFYRSNYERNMKLWKFAIHFLWRSHLTTTLWSWCVDIKPDKCCVQMCHQSSQ